MSGGPRSRQAKGGRYIPRLEWLEVRSLLSVYPPGIAAVNPYDGQRLDQSPKQLAISFDPSDIDSAAQFLSSVYGVSVPSNQVLATLLTTADVQLVSVNRDGSATPVFDFSHDSLQEQTDATGTELIVPLQVQNAFTGQIVNVTLSPGTYQLAIEGDTGLSFITSEAYLTDGQPLWDGTKPLVVSTFTVLGSGATLADASTLPIGPSAQTYTFSLNPDNFRTAVDVYKFTLPAGQLWQVGVAISTQNIDSPLLTTLSLFDSNGNLIAESNAGDGLPIDPNDPYLFAGLSPTTQSNTYYIAVSGYGNTAYGSRGYDPVLGIPGTRRNGSARRPVPI